MCPLGKIKHAAPALVFEVTAMQTTSLTEYMVASINGVALHNAGEALTADELRQRAYAELLRQTAILKGLLGNYERRQETAQVRLFRSDYDNRVDYVALVESRLPFSEPGMDLSLFGNAGNRIDLFNQYVPYWTRGHLPGVTTRS